MKWLNINKFYYEYGGAERFYFELQKMLENRGEKVLPFSMEHSKNKLTPYKKYFISEVQTETIQFNWQGLRTVFRYFWSFEATRKIKKLIKKEQPQVAILHNIYHQISPSILPVLKKNNLKTILIAHDYGLLSPSYNMFAHGKIYNKVCGTGFLKTIPGKPVKNSFWASLVCGLEMWFHHTILNVYQKNIDYVVCPSQFIKKMYLRAGWNKEKIIHLPYFLNTKNFNNNKTPEIKEKYILYFGRLSAEKGVSKLIDALKNLPKIKLKIAGTGPEEEKIKKQINELQLNNVELLGWQSGDNLNKLIKGAQFIVVPSLWYENYPLSILEAYALNTPALVSNLGGLPEIVEQNKDTFIFDYKNPKDLKNKINQLWKSGKILKKQSQINYNFLLEKHSPENYYQKLIELIK